MRDIDFGPLEDSNRKQLAIENAIEESLPEIKAAIANEMAAFLFAIIDDMVMLPDDIEDCRYNVTEIIFDALNDKAKKIWEE